jgi:hypothetical protein
VADSDHRGVGERPWPAGSVGEGSGEPRPRGAGAQLADPGGAGREGGEHQRYPFDGPAGERDCALAWPPGPADARAWGFALAVDPTLEPAIRGMADGLPHRVDRLRCLGNGVVPLAAAHAFRALAARAGLAQLLTRDGR